MYISEKKYYKIINEFAKKDNVHAAIDSYPKVFDAICCYWFRLPKRVRKSLMEGLGYGNWTHLWETDEEKMQTICELCKELQGEVFYCSDRMSWDRLLRIHWIWQRIQSRIQRDICSEL